MAKLEHTKKSLASSGMQSHLIILLFFFFFPLPTHYSKITPGVNAQQPIIQTPSLSF